MHDSHAATRRWAVQVGGVTVEHWMPKGSMIAGSSIACMADMCIWMVGMRGCRGGYGTGERCVHVHESLMLVWALAELAA